MADLSFPPPHITPEIAAAVRDAFLFAAMQEHATTRRVLAAAELGDWKPDPKSRSAAQLAWHIAKSNTWFLKSIAEGQFVPEDEGEPPKTIAEILKEYDEGWETWAPKVKALSGDKLVAIIDFFGMKFPVHVYMRFAEVHSIHHRGQLATYLRPLGGKCPDIYGGSADEPWKG